jgi:RNA polymerase sigma-70 factor (ECF subfamily)
MTNNYGDYLSDEELVALCQERLPGDPRPFSALVSRYQERVMATCLRLMGNKPEAEDQAQEVFIRVYRGIKNFEGRAKFSTWLFQISANTCRTALKKRGRRLQLKENLLSDPEILFSPARPLEEAALVQAETGMVTQALQMLSEEERVILTLRETDELSYQEIADTLDIGLSAAKMRVMRARLALKHAYQTLEKRYDPLG